jgi:hypothetical protein
MAKKKRKTVIIKLNFGRGLVGFIFTDEEVRMENSSDGKIIYIGKKTKFTIGRNVTYEVMG